MLGVSIFSSSSEEEVENSGKDPHFASSKARFSSNLRNARMYCCLPINSQLYTLIDKMKRERIRTSVVTSPLNVGDDILRLKLVRWRHPIIFQRRPRISLYK